MSAMNRAKSAGQLPDINALRAERQRVELEAQRVANEIAAAKVRHLGERERVNRPVCARTPRRSIAMLSIKSSTFLWNFRGCFFN